MSDRSFESRSKAYELLASAFTAEPDADAVRDFYSFDWGSLLGADCPLEEPDDCAAVASENRSEFARMFLGPKKRIAPPYESVYRSGVRRMGGCHAEDVRRCYEEAGVRRDGSVREPDDFVGFELQFASYLLAAASLAAESGDEDLLTESLKRYEEFLVYHLARWIPSFCDDILHADPKPFLALCARMLEAVVEYEAADR